MAIAFDACTNGGDNGGSGYTLTFSHTCSASADRVLFVWACGQYPNTDDIIGATYNGVAMTLVDKQGGLADNRFLYCFVLFDPATGANNVVITNNDNLAILGYAVSYTGVPGNSIDSYNKGSATGTSLTVSTTVVKDDCWLVGLFNGDQAAVTAGTGTTIRSAGGSSGRFIGDSNGTVGTGSQGLQINTATSQGLEGIVCSISASIQTTTSTSSSTSTSTTSTSSSTSTSTTSTSSSTSTTTSTSTSTSTSTTSTSSSTSTTTSTSSSTSTTSTSTTSTMPFSFAVSDSDLELEVDSIKTPFKVDHGDQ